MLSKLTCYSTDGRQRARAACAGSGRIRLQRSLGRTELGFYWPIATLPPSLCVGLSRCGMRPDDNFRAVSVRRKLVTWAAGRSPRSASPCLHGIRGGGAGPGTGFGGGAALGTELYRRARAEHGRYPAAARLEKGRSELIAI